MFCKKCMIIFFITNYTYHHKNNKVLSFVAFNIAVTHFFVTNTLLYLV